jgi:O-antigen/teichoic acid export membrane protein
MTAEDVRTARLATRGSGARVIAFVANTLVALVLMPFVVHHLGDRLYGYWVLIGTLLGYYGLVDLGITTAVQFYVAKSLGEGDAHQANRDLSTAFFAFAALGCLVGLLTVGVALSSCYFIASPEHASLFRTVVLIMGLGMAAGFPAKAFVGGLSAHLRWDVISWVSTGVLIVRTGLIVLVIEAGWSLLGLAVVTSLCGLFMYYMYYLALKKIHHGFHLSLAQVTRPSLKGMLGYSGLTMIIKVSNQLRFYVDAFVVGALLSTSAVTHYSIASRLALSYRDLMIAVFGALSPVFSRMLGRRKHGQIEGVFTFATTLSSALGCFIACGMILYGREFIQLWMGRSYVDAYWPLVFLAVAIFLETSQLPAVSYMYGVSRHRFLAYTTLFEGCANLALSLYLGRVHGLKGVALGTLIPMFLMWFFVEPIYVCVRMGISKRVFYFRAFLRPVLGVALVTLVPYFLFFSRLRRPTVAFLAIVVTLQVLIASVTFPFLVLNRQERAMLLTALKRMVPEGHSASQVETQTDLESVNQTRTCVR